MKKKHASHYSNNIEQINMSEYTFVYRLIGGAIVIYFITNCHIGLVLGILLAVILRVRFSELSTSTASKGLFPVALIAAVIGATLTYYRLTHPLNPFIMNPIDWVMVAKGIILTPAMTFALTLLFHKKTPLAERLHGWDRIPKDPKPKIGGTHPEGRSIVGHRINEFKDKIPVLVPFTPGKHGLVVAKTGSGKSAFISNIIESTCEHSDLSGSKRFVVVIDGKADKTEYSLYSLMQREAHRTGRKLHVIDIAAPEEQIDIFAGMDAVAIKDALVSMSEWSEPHYLASAAQFFSVLAEILLLADDETVTFKALEKYCQKSKITRLVNRLHREGKISELKHAEYLDTIEVTSDIARAAAPRFAVMTQGVGAKLFPTTKEECASALSIIDAYNNDDMVLVMINSMAYSEYAFAAGALVISAIKQLVSKAQIGDLPTKGILCVCDELSQYASETITQLYSQGRVAGLQIWGIVQSLTDFNKRLNSKSIHDTIIGNSSYIVNFSVTLPSDAEELAEIYSTVQVPEVTTQVAGRESSGMGSVKLVDQFVVHPRTLKNLPSLVGYIKYCGEDEPGPHRFTCRLVDFEK